jgi:glycosyltransferase involved in cell wall biosynthesis
MRVALNGLFLASPATGTGQYLRELVRAMQTQAPADEFVFIAPKDDPTAPARVQTAPTRLARENLAKLEFEQITFPRTSAHDFDLAHVPHFGSPLFPARPTVVTIHDLIPIVLPAYRGTPRVRLYTRLASAGARRARAILADSMASARDIENYLKIPRERIHVVHLAADARFHPPSEDEIKRVRAKYSLPDQFVLYLGGFDVRKNIERVIETFANFKFSTQRVSPGELNDLKLVLAGKLPQVDSGFFPDPRKMAQKFGVQKDTQFIGFVAEDDKPALYASARVFLFASRYEGFGLPPLEAMACATPVIVANTSSLPEVVGNAGILVDTDDAPAWNAALHELLTDNARWQEQRARGLAQAARFSWERASAETLRVYRSVV